MTPTPELVLASASPRRRQLLETLGLRFSVRPARLDENPAPQEPPECYVRRLAEAKARSVARPGELVLAADTVVVADSELLGKPTDVVEARRMLKLLVGREHQVLTGVALLCADDSRCAVSVERSTVRFAPMTESEIDWYLATREPLDKAGAYAVQGLGALFVDSVEGNYSNVVGLPLPATYRLFAALGYDLLELVRADRGRAGLGLTSRA